jgi:circadian clock protein KaiC
MTDPYAVTVPPLERLGTGNPALDRILDGGLPVRSATVIAGGPGTGKTVMALQMLFHLARQGRRGLYFTTLSEPALKLVRYMQLFGFFDRRLLDERVVFADLGTTIRSRDATGLLETITARVESEAAELVVVDSFKAIHDLLGGAQTGRTFIYDLAVAMAGWGATTLLVGEYAPAEIETAPEFAIVDGILRLSNEAQELTAVRTLEVLKLRGANYRSGRHFFEITPAGVAVYARVSAPAPADEPPAAVDERAATGVAGLDALLHGGVPRGSSTIVQGGTGTGKTLLGLAFLLEGARRGERGILFTLEETPAQLSGIAAGFGWDLPALEAQGLILVRYTSPVELSTDRFLDEAVRQVREWEARRVVLDSVSSVALGVPSERRFRELIIALSKHFRAAGVTALLTMEVTEMMGMAQLTGRGVSSIADNIVVLRYVEVRGRLERAISVLKARGIAHETELRRVRIDSGGLRVGAAFRRFRGVLTGVPVPVAEEAEPPDDGEEE